MKTISSKNKWIKRSVIICSGLLVSASVHSQTLIAQYDVNNGNNGAYDIVVDPSSGNAYVGYSNVPNTTITKIGPAATSGTIPSWVTVGTAPRGLDLDASGNIYAGLSIDHTIKKVTPGGVVTTVTASPFPGNTTPGSATGTISDIALDHLGNVYASITNGSNVDPYGDRVYKVNIATGAVTGGPYTTGSVPVKIVEDKSGNVYTSNYFSNSITKIAADGTVTTNWASTGTNPVGMAFDAAGNLYVANSGSNTVTKITPAGISSTFGATGNSPWDIAIDGADNVYTANLGNNITKIVANGTVTTAWASVPSGSCPQGIAVGGSSVYVTTNCTGNVYKYNGAVALPVRLMNFTAAAGSSQVDLHWNTISESNNRGFTIERSADGNMFSPLAFLATKAADGNSKMAINYSYTDAAPLTGKNFYRLRQEDADGTKSYSNVELVTIVVGRAAISAFPNPVTKTLNLTGLPPGAKVYLTNLNGKVCLEQSTESGVTELDLSPINSGLYLLQVREGNGTILYTGKFMKN